MSAGLFASLAVAPSLNARSIDAALETEQKLQKGEVVVGMKGEGETRLVTGTVLIDETPDNVWRVVVNPYEFRGKISPRMKDFQLLVDKRDRSVMRVNMDVLLIPHFNYVVESIYKPGEKIEFHRMKGTEQSLRDFNGSWEIQPRANGTKTALTYSMYMDPGFFVPQWLIREGVKGELPRTLSAIRKRVEAISANREKLATQTIAAASILPEAIAGKSAVNPL
ncbi:MAG TPA: SRPBCC family protein [Oculatellaceae cyanobacterium]